MISWSRSLAARILPESPTLHQYFTIFLRVWMLLVHNLFRKYITRPFKCCKNHSKRWSLKKTVPSWVALEILGKGIDLHGFFTIFLRGWVLLNPNLPKNSNIFLRWCKKNHKKRLSIKKTVPGRSECPPSENRYPVIYVHIFKQTSQNLCVT